MAWTKEQIDQVLAEIVRRSVKDADFRRLCLEDAAAAVKAVTSEPLPPDFKLRFIDNDHADLTVVLPDVVEGGRELSDDELSAVSGGVVTLESSVSLNQPVRLTSPVMPGPCFAAGTPVLLADGSTRPIEAITVGTRVLAYDDRTHQIVATTVSQRLEHGPERIYRASLEQMPHDLLVTPNHPVYSGGRWQAIGTLSIASELHAFDEAGRQATPRRLREFQATAHHEPVYNLEVEDVHSYFAHGVLVHNGRVVMK